LLRLANSSWRLSLGMRKRFFRYLMATQQNTTRDRPVSHDRTESGSRLIPSDAFSRLLEMDDGMNPKEPKITHHSARLKKSHRSADFISVGRKKFGPSSIVYLAFP